MGTKQLEDGPSPTYLETRKAGVLIGLENREVDFGVQVRSL